MVTYAEYTDEVTKEVTNYALKSLSKAAVVETGERPILLEEYHLLKGAKFFDFLDENRLIFVVFEWSFSKI